SKKVLIVDAASGQVTGIVDAGSETNFAGFTPGNPSDGNSASLLTVSSHGDATLWNTTNWKPVRQLPHPDYQEDADHHASFSSNGRRVLIWSSKGNAQVVAVATGEQLGKMDFE